MLTNLVVVIISQHIRPSSHHITHLRVSQCHVSVISQETWRNVLNIVYFEVTFGIFDKLKKKGGDCLTDIIRKMDS